MLVTGQRGSCCVPRTHAVFSVASTQQDAKARHRRQITGPNCPPCVHTHAPWRHQHLPSHGPLVPAHKNDSRSLPPTRRHRTGPAPLEATHPSIPSPTQTRGGSSRGEGGASPCWLELERDVNLKWVLLMLYYFDPRLSLCQGCSWIRIWDMLWFSWITTIQKIWRLSV